MALIAIIEQTWTLSRLVLPPGLLLLLAWTLHRRGRDDPVAVIVASQWDGPIRYRVELVTGLLGGGLLLWLVPGIPGVVAGSAVAAAAAGYAVQRHGLPEPPATLSLWRRMWALLPVLAAAAVTTQHPVLQSAAAVAVYATIFWAL